MSREANKTIIEDLRRQLLPIRMLAFDVDGVLTNGGIYLGTDDQEMLRFDVKDGSAISMAIRSDYLVALVTGRRSSVTQRRGEMLGIKDILLGVTDKRAALEELATKYSLNRSEILFVGDDILDLAAFPAAGFTACPADAAEDVLGLVDYRCSHRGGRGAIREIVELVLRSQGKWEKAVERIVGRTPHVPQ